MLEDPWQPPLQEMFQLSKSPQDAADESQEILIEFNKGNPIAVDGKEYSPAKLLTYLNELGRQHGIGRIDMVESRCV